MHDLLEQNNAYRLLVLPGNATHREIVAKTNRLRLRIHAGRELDIDDPFDVFVDLPELELAEFEAIVRGLDDPVQRLRCRLFRFTLSTPADQAAWKGITYDGDPDAMLAAWPAGPGIDARLNRARMLWWLCQGNFTGATQPWWRELLMLWGGILEDPDFFEGLAPEAIENTFERPASLADFREAIRILPDLLVEATHQVACAALEIPDGAILIIQFISACSLPTEWKPQLIKSVWEVEIASAEAVVRELEQSTFENETARRAAVIRCAAGLRKIGAENEPMAKRLRRRAGKWLHAQALIQEKNGTWSNAVGNIRAACVLLAGAPELSPAQEDSVRIEALAEKAAETVPPPVFKPVLTYPLNVPPPPAPPAPPAPQPPRHPANDVGVWPKTAPSSALLTPTVIDRPLLDFLIAILKAICKAMIGPIAIISIITSSILLLIYPFMVVVFATLGIVYFVARRIPGSSLSQRVARFKTYSEDTRTAIIAFPAMLLLIFFALGSEAWTEAVAERRVQKLAEQARDIEVELQELPQLAKEAKRAWLEEAALRRLPPDLYAQKLTSATLHRRSVELLLSDNARAVFRRILDYDQGLSAIERTTTKTYDIPAYRRDLTQMLEWTSANEPDLVYNLARLRWLSDRALDEAVTAGMPELADIIPTAPNVENIEVTRGTND